MTDPGTSTPDDEDFPTYLDRLRKAAGYDTLSDVARAAKVDPSVLSRWKTQTVRPTYPQGARVAEVLGVEPGDFMARAHPGRGPRPPLPAYVRTNSLISELKRLLGPDTPLTDEDRRYLEETIFRLVVPYRRLSRGTR